MIIMQVIKQYMSTMYQIACINICASKLHYLHSDNETQGERVKSTTDMCTKKD